MRSNGGRTVVCRVTPFDDLPGRSGYGRLMPDQARGLRKEGGEMLFHIDHYDFANNQTYETS